MRREADWLDRALAFGATFFLTGIALLLGWVTLESLSVFHVPGRGLRTMLLGLIGLAALAMGVRSARSARGRKLSEAETLETLARSRLAALPPDDAGQHAPARATPDPAIGAARARPIVFRQLFPPPADPGLSFYGGLPIGPADLAWPRMAADKGGAPLHFVMQWDCVQLAAADATGLLPPDGALYLFCDLEWRKPLSFRFVHAPVTADVWLPLAMPEDLGPVFGAQGAWLSPLASPYVPEEERDVPRLLPRWPFRAMPMAYPLSSPAGAGEGDCFWDENRSNEALLAAQDALGAPLATFERGKYAPFGRPFPSFPRDWAAVRIIAATAIGKLHRGVEKEHGFLPDLDAETRQATAARWLDEARALYRHATSHPAAAAVPASDADEIWAWIEAAQDIFFPFKTLVQESANASLGLRSEAIAAIPPELIARLSLSHSLAHAYVREQYRHEFLAAHGSGLTTAEAEERWNAARDGGTLPQLREVFAPTPSHLFGPPSYVQGEVAELVEDQLLLLELRSNANIGMNLGEGVVQFLIRPDDLRQRRFDKVAVIVTGY